MLIQRAHLVTLLLQEMEDALVARQVEGAHGDEGVALGQSHCHALHHQQIAPVDPVVEGMDISLGFDSAGPPGVEPHRNALFEISGGPLDIR